MFKKWLTPSKKTDVEETAIKLYTIAVKQARQEYFYAEWRVPDTVDGRFDMIVLHLFLMQYCLIRHNNQISMQLSQKIFDVMFWDMDQNLREMGVGDMGIPKRIKNMMLAFNGRLHSYDAAAQKGVDDLMAAIYRNLFREDPNVVLESVRPLAAYCLVQLAYLQSLRVDLWHSGSVGFETGLDIARAA